MALSVASSLGSLSWLESSGSIYPGSASIKRFCARSSRTASASSSRRFISVDRISSRIDWRPSMTATKSSRSWLLKQSPLPRVRNASIFVPKKQGGLISWIARPVGRKVLSAVLTTSRYHLFVNPRAPASVGITSRISCPCSQRHVGDSGWLSSVKPRTRSCSEKS